jgi:hypothetical protein
MQRRITRTKALDVDTGQSKIFDEKGRVMSMTRIPLLNGYEQLQLLGTAKTGNSDHGMVFLNSRRSKLRTTDPQTYYFLALYQTQSSGNDSKRHPNLTFLQSISVLPRFHIHLRFSLHVNFHLRFRLIFSPVAPSTRFFSLRNFNSSETTRV